MYRGFNLLLKDINNYSSYLKQGNEISIQHRLAIKQTLNDFVTDSGSLDGSRLQKHWFPQVKADVFISHSHKDIELATAFAGWLSVNFNLRPFIDSCVWGYADDLQNQIDKQYCLKPGSKTSYSYAKVKRSSSHIHMILSTALSMMIDNTECLVFLNTPNSISLKDSVSKTQSPWLFMEIAMSRIIRRKSPNTHRRILTLDHKMAIMSEAQLPQIEYIMKLSSLKDINISILMMWLARSKNKQEHPLDIIYKICPE